MTTDGSGADETAGLLGVHAQVIEHFLGRRAEEVAALCAEGAVLRLVHCSNGITFDEAFGPNGILSLVQRIHENIELASINLSNHRVSPARLDYDWDVVVRNWGFGGSRATSGSVRFEASNSLITLVEIALEPDIFYGMIRPDPRTDLALDMTMSGEQGPTSFA